MARTVLLSTAGDEVGTALVSTLRASGADVVELSPDGLVAEESEASAVVVRPPVPEPAPFLGADPEEWYAAVDVGLAPVHRVVRATIPRLRASGDGRIVVVLRGGWGAADRPGSTAAAAVAGALVAYVKTLARELGRHGTTVNAVVEGGGAQPEHVAAAIAYLLGDGAGSVTGQLLTAGTGGDLRP